MAVMVMHVCFLQFPVCLFSTILKKMKGLLTLFTFTGFPHKLTLPDPVITLDDTKRKFNLSAVNSPGRSLSDSITLQSLTFTLHSTQSLCSTGSMTHRCAESRASSTFPVFHALEVVALGMEEYT